MVVITQVLRNSRGKKLPAFIDSLRIYVRGGAGGTGLPKIGGVGGRGGNVTVTCSDKILQPFPVYRVLVENLRKVVQSNPAQRYLAGPGENSRKMKLLGSPGADIDIKAPVGVTVLSDDGDVLGDLTEKGQTVTVAQGGMGGCEATNFLGLPGQRRSVRLDLKLIADVGFVGFPNAGKSTLLKALSRARPKIASYPFTTLRPNLGVAEFDDFRRIAFADLPGLIEGAHLNEGMGHKFLKHVERTRVLLFVVDINGFQFKPEHPFRSAFETVLLLNRELELYKEELMNKPALCVVTKMDSKGSDRLYESFLEQMEKVQQRAGDEPRISTSRLSEESGEVGDEEEMININRLVHFDEIIPVSAKFSPKTVEVLKYKVRDWMDTYALNDDTRLHADQIAATLREKSNLY